MMQYWHWLFTILVVLNITDIVTTAKALNHPWAKELNPLVSFLMDKLGKWPALLTVKALFLGLVYFFVTSVIVLAIFNIIYVVICINNFIILKHLD